MRRRIRLGVLALICLWPLAGQAANLDTTQGPVTVEAMATGLDEPWSLGFLPGGDVLITERDGGCCGLAQKGV